MFRAIMTSCSLAVGAMRACAQTRIAHSARDHEVLMARNMMSNHTDMQDKYCGDCYDINPIQSQYKGEHKRGGAAEGRATSFVVAAKGRHLCSGFEKGEYRSSHHNTCLACRCDWTSCSSPLGHHVSSPFGQCTRLQFFFLSPDFY